MEIPKWLERILKIPGGGVCLLICLIPLLILLFIFMLLLYIVCLPVRCFCRLCCGMKPEDEEGEAAAANEEAAQRPGDPAANV